jgi:hypothetical protein
MPDMMTDISDNSPPDRATEFAPASTAAVVAAHDIAAQRRLLARYACTPRIKDDAYRTRYRGYLRHGFIKPHPEQRLTDHFDDTPHAPSIVVYDQDKPVGTVRACQYDPAHHPCPTLALPSGGLFELTAENIHTRFACEGRSGCAIEISKLAKIPESESDLWVTLALFRMINILVLAARAHVVLVAVRVPHMVVYRRLGFEMVESPRHFAKDDVVLGLMACRAADFQAAQCRAERIFRKPRSLSVVDIQKISSRLLNGDAVDVFQV